MLTMVTNLIILLKWCGVSVDKVVLHDEVQVKVNGSAGVSKIVPEICTQLEQYINSGREERRSRSWM